MSNVTLSVDEAELEAARQYAAERGTTVDDLLRDFLREIGGRKERLREAVEGLRELAEKSTLVVGPRTWTRDDLHER